MRFLGSWLWLRGRPLDVAIVVLTPPFAPGALLGFRLARLLRLLRVLRLARTAHLTRRMSSLDGVKWAAAVAGLVALGGGAAFAGVERDQHFSTADGLWWAASTMTTVGYGDVTPKTGLGRVIAVGVMVVGIGFVAFLTAAVAQRFVAQIGSRSQSGNALSSASWARSRRGSPKSNSAFQGVRRIARRAMPR